MVNNRPKLVTGWKTWFIRKRLRLFLFITLFSKTKNPFTTIKEVSRLKKLRNEVHGKTYIKKFIKCDGKYYWAANFAGLPSPILKSMILNEWERNRTPVNSYVSQQTVFWAITNRCPLKCAHCFEWDNISSSDKLSLNQLKLILSKIEQQGIKHIQLSGGEPVVRFEDLISLINAASNRIDFWLFTSGFGL